MYNMYMYFQLKIFYNQYATYIDGEIMDYLHVHLYMSVENWCERFKILTSSKMLHNETRK